MNNHVQDVVAMAVFVVPTVTFWVLCVLVLLAQERWRVLHVNTTAHLTAQWTAHQVVATVPWDEAPRYFWRDRDRISGTAFRQRVQHIGIEEVMMARRSPWRNP